MRDRTLKVNSPQCWNPKRATLNFTQISNANKQIKRQRALRTFHVSQAWRLYSRSACWHTYSYVPCHSLGPLRRSDCITFESGLSLPAALCWGQWRTLFWGVAFSLLYFSSVWYLTNIVWKFQKKFDDSFSKLNLLQVLQISWVKENMKPCLPSADSEKAVFLLFFFLDCLFVTLWLQFHPRSQSKRAESHTLLSSQFPESQSSGRTSPFHYMCTQVRWQ